MNKTKLEQNQQKLKLTQAQREELDRRLNAYEQDGQSGSNAGKVLEGIRRRL